MGSPEEVSQLYFVETEKGGLCHIGMDFRSVKTPLRTPRGEILLIIHPR